MSGILSSSYQQSRRLSSLELDNLQTSFPWRLSFVDLPLKVKLNPQNYPRWSTEVSGYLQAFGLWDYVEKRCPIRTSTNSSIDQTDLSIQPKRFDQAELILRVAVSDEHADMLRGYEGNPHGIWELLRSAFEETPDIDTDRAVARSRYSDPSKGHDDELTRKTADKRPLSGITAMLATLRKARKVLKRTKPEAEEIFRLMDVAESALLDYGNTS
jgi:hypothetical protein